MGRRRLLVISNLLLGLTVAGEAGVIALDHLPRAEVHVVDMTASKAALATVVDDRVNVGVPLPTVVRASLDGIGARSSRDEPDYLARGLSPGGAPVGWRGRVTSDGEDQAGTHYFAPAGTEVTAFFPTTVSGLVPDKVGLRAVTCVLQPGQTFVPRTGNRNDTVVDVTSESREAVGPGCPVGLRGTTPSRKLNVMRYYTPAMAEQVLRGGADNAANSVSLSIALVDPALAPSGFVRGEYNRGATLGTMSGVPDFSFGLAERMGREAASRAASDDAEPGR